MQEPFRPVIPLAPFPLQPTRRPSGACACGRAPIHTLSTDRPPKCSDAKGISAHIPTRRPCKSQPKGHERPRQASQFPARWERRIKAEVALGLHAYRNPRRVDARHRPAHDAEEKRELAGLRRLNCLWKNLPGVEDGSGALLAVVEHDDRYGKIRRGGLARSDDLC